MKKAADHKWTFRRLGGLDQVVLDKADDFCRLRELDPKLWVALSSPTTGLEMDGRTLVLLDTNQDGRIRIPDVIAAVEWTCAHLRNPADLTRRPRELPLSAIRDDSEDGARLLETARIALKNVGKEDAESLGPEDAAKALAQAAGNMFNGDGVMPPLPGLEADMQQFIRDGLSLVGGVRDASGLAGLNRPLGELFLKTLEDWRGWKKGLDKSANFLDPHTSAAWDLIQKLKPKIDDYFLRCDLVAYAPQTQDALNVDEKLTPLAETGLTTEELAKLPLARIEAARPLDLKNGLNPAWRADVQALAALLAPMLEGNNLTREKWQEIQDAFAPYAQALSAKPGEAVLDGLELMQKPAAQPDSLSDERIDEILAGDQARRFFALVDKDKDTPATAGDFAEVEKLVLFYCHLYRLLVNFVSFHDFYSLESSAAFQVGTLYLDGRGCELCVPVADVAKHSVLAAFSRLFLVYCECTRRPSASQGAQPDNAAPEKKIIAAAITAGDEDLLVDNRNGVFVDKKGQDWDATVVKIISNPISIRQAMLSPYKRVARLISEQVQKFAGEKEGQAISGATTALTNMGTAAATPATPGVAAAPPPKFDLGKNLGIFAALGLALGAIGTALASLAGALVSLAWWQVPLVFLAIFLLISGPSMIMAAVKLHQRTLGPLLEASGWAVNGKVSINYMLGSALTATAVLPPNSSRSYRDPLKRRRAWPWVAFALAVLAGAAVAAYFLYWKK